MRRLLVVAGLCASVLVAVLSPPAGATPAHRAGARAIDVTGTWELTATQCGFFGCPIRFHLGQTGDRITGWAGRYEPMTGAVAGKRISLDLINLVASEDGFSANGVVTFDSNSMWGVIVDGIGESGIFVADRVSGP